MRRTFVLKNNLVESILLCLASFVKFGQPIKKYF
jgi:hypothetical protein